MFNFFFKDHDDIMTISFLSCVDVFPIETGSYDGLFLVNIQYPLVKDMHINNDLLIKGRILILLNKFSDTAKSAK